MTDDDKIRAALDRLAKHFKRVLVHAPARASALDEIVTEFPALPPQLRAFYEIADGLQVGLDDEVVGVIFSVDEMIETHESIFEDHPSRSMLLPLRGDGCGDFDCVVASDDLANGSLVFWDHEKLDDRPVQLLAGSVASYLDMWSEHLVHQYLPRGELHPDARAPRLDRWPWVGTPKRCHPWPHDTEWLVKRDPRAGELLANAGLGGWFSPDR